MKNKNSFFQSSDKQVAENISTAGTQLPSVPTPNQTFYANLMPNTLLSISTVPAEGMALRRIFYMLSNPQKTPMSYGEIYNNIGIKGLFSGLITRTSYCLSANWVVLHGLDYFGNNYQGVVMTSLAQNATLPVFITSNGRQTSRTIPQTATLVAKGIIDPVVHSSFFFRNVMTNACIFSGLYVRDYYYKATGNAKAATTLGFGVATTSAVLATSFLKPFYTGSYPFMTRWRVAAQFPSKLPLLAREMALMGLLFGNTSPKKTEPSEEIKVRSGPHP